MLKLWVRCCLLGMLGPDDPWKRRLERVRNRGKHDVCMATTT